MLAQPDGVARTGRRLSFDDLSTFFALDGRVDAELDRRNLAELVPLVSPLEDRDVPEFVVRQHDVIAPLRTRSRCSVGRHGHSNVLGRPKLFRKDLDRVRFPSRSLRLVPTLRSVPLGESVLLTNRAVALERESGHPPTLRARLAARGDVQPTVVGREAERVAAVEFARRVLVRRDDGKSLRVREVWFRGVDVVHVEVGSCEYSRALVSRFEFLDLFAIRRSEGNLCLCLLCSVTT